MPDQNLADYFAQYGVHAGADVNLADLVPLAQQNITAGGMNRIAGYPELTATGAPVRSSLGTYWSVPTAQGMRYITPETFSGPSGNGADGASFTSALTNSVQKPWTVQNGDDGYWYAKGANPSQARYSGAGLGLGDEWGGSNAYYNVYDQAPEEKYYKTMKEPDGFFSGLMELAGPLMGVYGAGLGISGLMNGFSGFSGLDSFLNGGGTGSNGFSFPGLEGMSGYDAAGNLSNTQWGVNPINGGGMPYEDYRWDLGFGDGGPNVAIDYANPGSVPDVTIPSSYGTSGYPSTGIFQNGAPGGGLPFGGEVILDGGQKIPLKDFYNNYLGLSGSEGGGLLNSGTNLLKSLGGGGGFSLPGAGLGALAGLLGGSKQAGTTTTIQDIPDWLKPYVMGNLNAATAKSIELGAQTPLLGPAQDEMMKTIKGDYLRPESNPYLKDTVNDALGQVQSRFNSQYMNMQGGGDNMLNSGFQEGLVRNLSATALPMYNQNYQTERNRQFGAATTAPDYTTSQYNAAFSPFTAYSQLTKGMGSQTTSPYFTNPLAGALGGAALGSQFGKIFSGGGPFG
jgi:hypothetical protein